MKSLKEYIGEGLLDRVKNKEVNHKILIEEFLETNYKIAGSYDIKVTKNGSVVDVNCGVEVINKNIISLTNGLFEFGEVSGWFLCSNCKSLTSLKGAPKKVEEDFWCRGCDSLKTLEGAPKEVECDFDCSNCKSLTSLKGAPEKVDGDFYCNNCDSLKSLEDAPEKIWGDFICSRCKSLKSLEGAPKEVGRGFYCNGCGIQFTEEDVKKYTTVVKKIYI